MPRAPVHGAHGDWLSAALKGPWPLDLWGSSRSRWVLARGQLLCKPGHKARSHDPGFPGSHGWSRVGAGVQVPAFLTPQAQRAGLLKAGSGFQLGGSRMFCHPKPWCLPGVPLRTRDTCPPASQWAMAHSEVPGVYQEKGGAKVPHIRGPFSPDPSLAVTQDSPVDGGREPRVTWVWGTGLPGHMGGGSRAGALSC